VSLFQDSPSGLTSRGERTSAAIPPTPGGHRGPVLSPVLTKGERHLLEHFDPNEVLKGKHHPFESGVSKDFQKDRQGPLCPTTLRPAGCHPQDKRPETVLLPPWIPHVICGSEGKFLPSQHVRYHLPPPEPPHKRGLQAPWPAAPPECAHGTGPKVTNIIRRTLKGSHFRGC
jgi:hypothetical protein